MCSSLSRRRALYTPVPYILIFDILHLSLSQAPQALALVLLLSCSAPSLVVLDLSLGCCKVAAAVLASTSDVVHGPNCIPQFICGGTATPKFIC